MSDDMTITSGDSAATFGLVIPTYNRPDFVRDAVLSALGQTRPFDRIVVVCDGPQPTTEDALRELDCDVLVVENGGVSAARNAGIAALDTDWVCFLDDDDLLHPAYLETYEKGLEQFPDVEAANTYYLVMGAHRAPGVDFVAHDYASAVAALPRATTSRSFAYMHIYGESYDKLLEHMRGSLTGSAVKRDILLAAGGFPTDLRCAEDWTMYVNVSRLTEWGTNPTPLVIFREHDKASGTAHGGVRNGLDTLRAVASFWAPSSLPTPPHGDLHEYREDYRFILRWTLDLCRREKDRASFREAMRIATPILPRWRDRTLSRIPEPLWEWARTRLARLTRRRRPAGDAATVSG
ncbi:MAG: glycosyltransferase family A protein [Microbacterium sp.]